MIVISEQRMIVKIIKTWNLFSEPGNDTAVWQTAVIIKLIKEVNKHGVSLWDYDLALFHDRK